MAVRTRGPDIKACVAKFRADRAAREEAVAVVDRWNWRQATGRDMLTGREARRHAWLVFCPGCGTSRSIDMRTLDRRPLASVGTLVLGLRVSPGAQALMRARGLRITPLKVCVSPGLAANRRVIARMRF